MRTAKLAFGQTKQNRLIVKISPGKIKKHCAKVVYLPFKKTKWDSFATLTLDPIR